MRRLQKNVGKISQFLPGALFASIPIIIIIIDVHIRSMAAAGTLNALKKAIEVIRRDRIRNIIYFSKRKRIL